MDNALFASPQAALVDKPIATVLVVDDNLLRMLLILTAGIVLVKNLPAIRRIANKTEMRMSLEEDISYKFDETF